MKIQFHIRGINITARARSSLKELLERLQSLIPITAAAVALEHSRDSGPAFRAFVLLAVPGRTSTPKHAITRWRRPGSRLTLLCASKSKSAKPNNLRVSSPCGSNRSSQHPGQGEEFRDDFTKDDQTHHNPRGRRHSARDWRGVFSTAGTRFYSDTCGTRHSGN